MPIVRGEVLRFKVRSERAVCVVTTDRTHLERYSSPGTFPAQGHATVTWSGYAGQMRRWGLVLN